MEGLRVDDQTVPTADPPKDPGPAPALAPVRASRQPPGFGEFMIPFVAASDVNPRFQLMSLGGRWMVMLFYGGLDHPVGRAAHDRIVARRALFDDDVAQFFGVSADPADKAKHGLANSMPGLRYFWDFDGSVTRGYGLQPGGVMTPTVFLVDPFMRVADRQPAENIDAVLDSLAAILAAEREAPDGFNAPVLTVPRILEPEVCRALIDYYHEVGGKPSGFMRHRTGEGVYGMLDDKVKRREDVSIADPDLCAAVRKGVERLAPAMMRTFLWRPSRIERYIVAHYSADDGGFFSRHRDNTTPATAHRRFAVTINLNDDFDGGELRFPEFGRRTYRPPLGGATVFNCYMLHEATPVTRGERYATLPFLYDEEGQKVRAANVHTITDAPPGVTPAPGP